MRSVEEQQARVSAAAVAPRPVRVAIAEAQGLLCAEEVVTEHPLPGFDQAAIDGYAVRSVDVPVSGRAIRPIDQADDELRSLNAVEGSSPARVTLPVMGTVQAGARTPSRLQPGRPRACRPGRRCRRWPTRCCRCAGLTAGSRGYGCCAACRSGAYVRRTGDDVQPGDVAVRAGTIIGAAQVGLLAAVGRDRVLVHPRPRVSVLAVGGELVDISRTPGNGQVYDVNSLRVGGRCARRGRGGEPGRHRQQRSARNSAKSLRVSSIAPRSW